jgi:serine protease
LEYRLRSELFLSKPMFSESDVLSGVLSLDRLSTLSTHLHVFDGGLDSPLFSDNELSGASLVLPPVTSDPGNTFSQAYNIGVLNGTSTFSDFVGSTDTNDYYRFDLSASGSLNLVLNGLSADADVQVFNSAGTLVGSSYKGGSLAESINLSGLTAGTYYARVYQYSGNTNYNLNLTADYAGNTTSNARNIDPITGIQTFRDYVGKADANDYYQFNLSTPGSLNLVLNGLSSDANLQVLNSAGTVIGSSSNLGTTAESISLSGLAAGNYYILVNQSSGDTNYNLSLSGASVDLSTISPLFTRFSVSDASGDTTSSTVFQGGAMRLGYTFQNAASLSNVRLEAWRNGSMISTLGTWSGASVSNALVNLASFSALTAGDYQFRVVASTTSGVDVYSSAQSISILSASRINGTVAPDKLEYSVGLGTGAIFLGYGGTDRLNLGTAGIARSNITSINGFSLSTFNPLSGSTASQAIYGGTAFDYITLADGREIYFQGIEYLQFADGTSLELQVHPNDTFFSDQWNLSVSDVTSAWRFTQGSSDVLLVSLDTGILTVSGGSGGITDIATNRLITDATDDDNYNNYGHGHSAISIMSSTANNRSGIAGINWNSSVYVTDVYNGVTLKTAITDAIKYARDRNMRVVFQGGIQGEYWLNYSGGTQEELEQLIEENSDIALFAVAAGNGNVHLDDATSNSVYSAGFARLQGTHENVIAVGALQPTTKTTVNGLTNATNVNRAWYSNYGNDVLMAATDSPAMTKSGDMTIFGGTSAANPNMAGIASLVWSVNPTLEANQVRQILFETAMDLGTVGQDNTFGRGLVNADAAVRRAVALQRNSDVANLFSGASLFV